jgi:hypothetical protein
MILKTRDNREVEVEFEHSKHPEDSFIAQAYYMDEEINGDPVAVPDNVIEELNDDFSDVVQEEWFEHQIGRADFYGDD